MGMIVITLRDNSEDDNFEIILMTMIEITLR